VASCLGAGVTALLINEFSSSKFTYPCSSLGPAQLARSPPVTDSLAPSAPHPLPLLHPCRPHWNPFPSRTLAALLAPLPLVHPCRSRAPLPSLQTSPTASPLCSSDPVNPVGVPTLPL